MVEADATRRTSSEFYKSKTQQMKPTHFNVVMSMIFMYKQDVLTLDQLHECLEKYEIRPRRKRKSRAKSYKVEKETQECPYTRIRQCFNSQTQVIC